jgi:hypothetical protein
MLSLSGLYRIRARNTPFYIVATVDSCSALSWQTDGSNLGPGTAYSTTLHVSPTCELTLKTSLFTSQSQSVLGHSAPPTQHKNLPSGLVYRWHFCLVIGKFSQQRAALNEVLSWFTLVPPSKCPYSNSTTQQPLPYTMRSITPYSPLKANRRFGGTYRLHLQSRISRVRY